MILWPAFARVSTKMWPVKEVAPVKIILIRIIILPGGIIWNPLS